MTSAAWYYDYVIVGGGIAGVVCAETLCELLNPSKFSGANNSGLNNHKQTPASVVLISATNTVKITINLRRISKLIEAFDIEETSGDIWSETWPNTLKIIYDIVTKLDPSNRLVYLKSQDPIRYGQLCLTTGGVPRLINYNHPLVIGLRDTESLENFQTRLRDTRRLFLVGNGGIATEIAHEVSGCQLVWAIKDASISAPFLDPAAARFILNAREASRQKPQLKGEEPVMSKVDKGPTQIRRMRYVVSNEGCTNDEIPADAEGRLRLVVDRRREQTVGAALGPDWAHGRTLCGQLRNVFDSRILKIVYEVRVVKVLTTSEFRELGRCATDPFPNDHNTTAIDDWPVYVELSNGEIYGCDLIVSAVGVEASFCPLNALEQHDNVFFFGTHFDRAPIEAGGGLLVNDQMQTSVPYVYAAGDCAYANWTWAPQWFQMRLWSQARQMGFQAGKCMFGHSQGEDHVPLDFSFELFTHVTYFFGFKVVLIGLFNGQGLDLTSPDFYLLMRVTPGLEYIKCVMHAGRMQGALLIGDTDLEETLENLILNQIDLTDLEDHLLDPDIDLSDYFD